MAPWPLPQEYEHGSSTLWLSPDAQYIVEQVEVTADVFAKVWTGLQLLKSELISHLSHKSVTEDILRIGLNPAQLSSNGPRRHQKLFCSPQLSA